ncbi:MAG: hypothetical protein IBJ03_15800 [Gemmatimonadaceae bacterium]|nr:hypothetical protein [Gemmatimonadaceae bacterium]
MEILKRRTRGTLGIGSLLVTALLAACGGNDSGPTGPSGNCAPTPPTGTMTAQVNGAAFTANFSTQATIQNSTAMGPNIVQISGVGCVDGTATRVQQILITLGRLTPITVGTYRLDPAAQAQPAGSGYSGIGQFVSAPNLWYSNRSDETGPGVGSITFTTITANRLAGTFSLVLVSTPGNTSGNTGRVTVANGAFDIPTP